MSQIKSKQRVAKHGEVFTNQREVSNMLDLVINETERIDSRFLEPACGDGNFLSEVLIRKLGVLKRKYSRNVLNYERNLIVAVSSLYGIDILEDNVLECRERLQEIAVNQYKELFELDNQTVEVIKYIIAKNIIWGDALTLLKINKEPIIFCEWTLVNDNYIKRRDFTLIELLNFSPTNKDERSLFSDLDEEVFIPTPIKEYSLVNYRRLTDYD